jgi:hypothetical protein
MRFHIHRIPWALACAGVIAWHATGPAQAQPTTAATPAACQSVQLQPAQLYGQWSLLLWPENGNRSAPVATGTAHFERHPEYPGSVRGRLTLSTQAGETLLSGDATDGEFNLDESEDGVAISAVWYAAVNPTDCGRRLQGTRRPAEGRPADEVLLNFELSKMPGWQ